MGSIHNILVRDVAKAVGLRLCQGCDGFYDDRTTRFVDHRYFTEQICAGCNEFDELQERVKLLEDSVVIYKLECKHE